MFGLSWAEIGIIMAAAVIFIGPKDLPVAVRTVASLIRKARGMAGEFQSHVDDMMRDANLSDVKSEFSKLRRFDFAGAAERMVDPAGTPKRPSTMRHTLIRNLDSPSVVITDPNSPPIFLGEAAKAPTGTQAAPGQAPGAPAAVLGPAPVYVQPVEYFGDEGEIPAFVPPAVARRKPMPEFIPPSTKRWGW